MKTFLKNSWKFILNVVRWAPIAAAVIVIILFLYPMSWTGFGDYAMPNGEFIRGKTLWDWMELLVIPFFLWAGAVAVNRSEKEIERRRIDENAKIQRELEADRQLEAVLQAYIGHMSDLLLNEKLRTTERLEVWDVARIRTLSAMRVLDTRRNNVVLQFLREANLIVGANSIFHHAGMVEMNLQQLNFVNVNLDQANLTNADLRDCVLHKASLQKALLINANLQGARALNVNMEGAVFLKANLESVTLANTNMTNAILSESTLIDAVLLNVNLNGANLQDADLSGANLKDADLTDANLQNAKVTNEQLAITKSLKGAILPDGTIHE